MSRGTVLCNRRTWLWASLAGIALLTAPRAWALSLEEAKAQGWVGERPDGLLGVVKPDAPDEVRELVDRINARRLEKYAEIAKKRGVPVDAVAVIAGRKLIEKTPPGWYVMDEKGNWYRKPAE